MTGYPMPGGPTLKAAVSDIAGEEPGTQFIAAEFHRLMIAVVEDLLHREVIA